MILQVQCYSVMVLHFLLYAYDRPQRAITALLLCFGLLFHISVGFSISSAQLLPPVIFQTLVHYHPLSLCFHWFLCVLTSLTSTGTESEKWDTQRWVGNMTYLPTHSHKLSHVSCRVISSLVDLFHLTRWAFKYTEIIHANLHHAITLACLHIFWSFGKYT